MAKLNGKVAVVTGATGALGKALCQRLSRNEGVTVWATDIDVDRLATLESELKSYATEVRTFCLDVRDKTQLREFAAEVLRRDKRLDFWINNAGIPPNIALFKDIPVESFEKVCEVNFLGVVNGTRIALQHMHDEGRGLIVNIASLGGLVATPYWTDYCATKHAIVGFTRSLQTELELTDSQVQTLLVCPGFFKSQIIDNHATTKFPNWLRWILSEPDSVAKDIIVAIKKGKPELISSLNGKLTQRMHAIAPRMTRRSAKFLLAKSVKDIFLNRFDL